MSVASPAYAELGAVAPVQAARATLDPAHALLLGMTLSGLQRVVTRPGSGDRAFIRALVAVHPDLLSEAQRAHIMRLAWRYRLSLPDMLRPARDPDAEITR